MDPIVEQRAARLPDGSVVWVVTLDRYQPPVWIGGPVTLTHVHLGAGTYQSLVHAPAGATTMTYTTTERVASDRFVLESEFTASAAALGLALEIDAVTRDALPDTLQDCYHMQITSLDVERVVHLPSDPQLVDVDFDALATCPKNWEPGAIGRAMGPALSTSFPGWLSGWREQAIAIAKEYCRDVYTHNGIRDITANVVSYYDPPRTVPASGRGRNARAARQEFTTTSLKIETPALIAGATLADAQERWTARIYELRALLESYTLAKRCSHCNGTGWRVDPLTSSQTSED